MKIYIGADHNGFELKKELLEELTLSGYEVIDEGDRKFAPGDDYPQFAARVVMAMKGSDDINPRGILICGSGQGICMAANRFKGMRAALCWDVAEARAARNDDDANILCLPARFIQSSEAVKIVETWLVTPFAGAPRFKRRIAQLDELGN